MERIIEELNIRILNENAASHFHFIKKIFKKNLSQRLFCPAKIFFLIIHKKKTNQQERFLFFKR